MPGCLIALLCFAPADARLSYETAGELVRDHTPRDAGTAGGRKAAAFLRKSAAAAGAVAWSDEFVAETPMGRRRMTNVLAEVRGADTNAPWIVLLSHYDTKTGVDCPGANDGAATSGLLVGLAHVLSRRSDRRGNFLFVWTDGEECFQNYGENDGLWGAKQVAKELARQRRRVSAVICLDMLGDKDLAISVPPNGTEELRQIAFRAAARAGLGCMVCQSSYGVIDDHVPFLIRGFSALDLIDFSYGPNNSWWHTSKDTMDGIAEDSLLKSGRLVLEIIDEVQCSSGGSTSTAWRQ